MKKKVKKLIDRAEDVLNQHKIDRLRRAIGERAQEIKDAPYQVQTDFYCKTCNKDFGGTGFKEIITPKGSIWFSFYVSFCPEGHRAIRYITDKLKDPYFYESPFIRYQQERFEETMLTPHDPRFKILYPEAYRKYILQEK